MCCLNIWTILEGFSQVREAKEHLSVTQDGATTDFHGPRVRCLRQGTRASWTEWTALFVTSSLTDRVTVINVMGPLRKPLRGVNQGDCHMHKNSVLCSTHSASRVVIVSSELMTLQLGCCETLTGEVIKAIASTCREFKSSTSPTCSKLTNDSIRAISNDYLEIATLNRADFSRNTEESSKALVHIVIFSRLSSAHR